MARRVSVSPASDGVVQAAPEPGRRPVPVRTILATIALVLATVALCGSWLRSGRSSRGSWSRRSSPWRWRPLVRSRAAEGHGRPARAGDPARVRRRARGPRRRWSRRSSLPLASEGTQLAGQLPQLVEDARAGRGPVGGLLDRTNALEYVQQHQAQIRVLRRRADDAGRRACCKGVATGVAGT